jgi:Tfp pilus assembly protein PilV
MRALSYCAAALRGCGSQRRPADAGFALVEVMVSAVLLIVLALATYPVIEQASQRASTNNNRSVAANIAAADQGRMRQMNANMLANYGATTTKVVKGITYTIVSSAEVTRDSSGVVACQLDTGRLEYFRLSSTVTWPQMGGVDPVTVHSIMAPGVAALGPNKGTLTVRLQRANGTPVQGASVNAGGLSDVTDSGGCAVFALVSSGNIPVSWSMSGYVSHKGETVPTKSVAVAGGSTSNLVEEYDAAAAVQVNFKDTANTVGPAWRSVSGANAMLGAAPRVFTAAAAQQSLVADKLFPFLDGYSFYAGSCGGNNPGSYLPNYWPAAPGAVTPAPAQTLATNVWIPKFPITVVRGTTSKVPLTNARVRITPDLTTPSAASPKMAGCNEVLGRLAVVPAVQAPAYDDPTYRPYTAALPYGLWDVCVDHNSGSQWRKKTFKINNTPAGSTTVNNVSQVQTVRLTSSEDVNSSQQCPA